MATQLFPRLLQLVEKYPDTRKLFQAKVKFFDAMYVTMVIVKERTMLDVYWLD